MHTFNKVELAKMLGLEFDNQYEYGGDVFPDEYTETKDLTDCYHFHYFCGGKIKVIVDDKIVSKFMWHPDKHPNSPDSWRKHCLYAFLQEYHDLVWELAADKYLDRIKRAALVVGG